MSYRSSASSFRHGSAPRTAVLLLNLGTPEAPRPGAVRRYLRQFLMDPRVVEIPRPVWWLLLNLIILPLRGAASAARYAGIWGPEGSPLLVNARRQQAALQAALTAQGLDVEVALAMRYGQPAVDATLTGLRDRGVVRILALPLYPQYSATTTASALDAVMEHLTGERDLPELRWVRNYHDDAGYIAALAASVREHWARTGGPGQTLVMSFHGLPRRNLDLGDPYHCECRKTARLLAEALGLAPGQYAVSFQSRFGRARWLEPYTVDTLRALARAGQRRVDVVCPGFTADCLETLEEIAQEGRDEFLAAGGSEFHAIACLNDRPDFIQALAGIARQHLAGWPVDVQAVREAAERAQAGAARARALGAGV
jgi:ferrochelatase